MNNMFRFGLVLLGILAIVFFLKNQKGEAEDNAVNTTAPKAISVDFKELHGELSESEIVSKYADIKLLCGNEPSPMAERYCYSTITNFNGMDAKLIAFFFEKNKLTQVKIDLEPGADHRLLVDRYTQEFGQPFKVPKPENKEPLIGWILNDGALITSMEDHPQQEMLLWINSFKLWRKEWLG